MPKFTCDKCDFSALMKGLLSTHKRIVHDVHLHQKCPHCDWKTYSNQKMRCHIDSQHPDHDEKKFFCEHCSKGFIFKNSLQQHVRQFCKLTDEYR